MGVRIIGLLSYLSVGFNKANYHFIFLKNPARIFGSHTLSSFHVLPHSHTHPLFHPFIYSLTHSPLTFYTLDVIVKWLITVLCTEWYGTSSVVAGWQDDNAPLSWASKLVQSAVFELGMRHFLQTNKLELKHKTLKIGRFMSPSWPTNYQLWDRTWTFRHKQLSPWDILSRLLHRLDNSL